MEHCQVVEADGDPIVDEEEFAVVRTMKTKKAAYRDSFEELKVLKSEVEYLTKLTEQSRTKLVLEYDSWYKSVYEDGDDIGKVVTMLGQGNMDFTADGEVMDDAEKFDRMEVRKQSPLWALRLRPVALPCTQQPARPPGRQIAGGALLALYTSACTPWNRPSIHRHTQWLDQAPGTDYLRPPCSVCPGREGHDRGPRVARIPQRGKECLQEERSGRPRQDQARQGRGRSPCRLRGWILRG